MNELIVVLLGTIALAYVAAPLVRQQPAEPVASGRSNDAEKRKARALDALLDLEADYETGKLSSDEFEVLRAEHERDALNALRELDVLEASAAGDDIEIQVAAERARLTCPSCGARRPEEGRCPSCGV